MMYVRHQSAAGGSGSWWRYDGVRKVVVLMLQRGSITVDVCSTAYPRFGSFPVVRVDACTWKIVPARYTRRGAIDHLLTETQAIDAQLGVEPIALLDAPDGVALELAELGR